MSVARTPDVLVIDVESCNQLVRCPRCGVIAQGHGRMVVEVIDAPWSRVPMRIRWNNTALDMPRTRLPDRDLHRVQHTRCAPPGRIWPPRRSGGRLVSSVSREPLSLARPAMISTA